MTAWYRWRQTEATPGNHEFDDGDTVLKGFLDELARGSCKTSMISSNVESASWGSPSPAKPSTRHACWPPPVSTTKWPRRKKPLTNSRLKACVTICGDSHSPLGNFKAVRIASSSGSYPTLVTSKNGGLVRIGQSWEHNKAFGLMNLQFNEASAIKSCAGKASLVAGDSFKRKGSAGVWQVVSDIVQTALVANQPLVKILIPDADAAATFKTCSNQVAAEKAKPIGTTTESLCLVRVPGESTSRSASVAGCEASHTLARGSDSAQAHWPVMGTLRGLL